MIGTEKRCHSCAAPALTPVYEVAAVPVHSVLLLESREAALDYPRRDIRLEFCGECGFVQNSLFDPGVHEYAPGYEPTQGFSPRFTQFARQLASGLIERYGLRGKTILEIGCGKGEFLALMCELGGNRGVGIDPSYTAGRISGDAAGRITFIRDMYSDRYAEQAAAADAIICRHTLEHIQGTRDFVRTVRRTIGDRRDTIVVFEVPDVLRILRERAFSDIYYEHCSYFGLGSLGRLFRSSGFEVLDLRRVFGDQYALIEARPDGEPGDRPLAGDEGLDRLAREVEAFRAQCPQVMESWRDKLRGIMGRGERAVLWGGGSKAVSFLTTLGLGDEIAYVVDVNPHKHGTYLAGTGHRVMPPQHMRRERPDVVIAMNPIYRGEIGADLDRLSVRAELISL